LNIAVNTRLLLKDKLEGIGWFTYETLKRITTLHKEHRFFFLFDRPFDESFLFNDNITPLILSPQARHPFLYYWWFEHSIPKTLIKIQADLFLSPDGYLALRSNVPSIPVIHDINFEHFPENLPYLTRHYYQYFFPLFAKKAKRIATVSEFSKNDICKTYDISENKIDVVFNGVNELYATISDEEKTNHRNYYSGGDPYFLFVGSLHPRKNVANLFRAFDQFKSQKPGKEKLLIIGSKKWWTKDIRMAYESMANKSDVLFKSHCSPNELKHIIPSALAMTYVSLFEGFGIPIIEAMQCGTPVITSNVSSMPEVAGEAAFITDPYSITSISAAMTAIASDSNLRNELILKGLKRAEDFSWDKTAAKLWTTLEKTLA
jgi:glycosyltransferase involved in cell wall biosynthesis